MFRLRCVCVSERDSKGIYIHPNEEIPEVRLLTVLPPLPTTLLSDALLITLSHCLNCHFALHFHSPIISHEYSCLHAPKREGGAVDACGGGGEGVGYGLADAMTRKIATGCHLIILRNHRGN